MTKREWPVLVVDDEPDVLSVSKLAMKNFTVYGLPIKLYTASSKADALDLLSSTLTLQGRFHHLAVAFIDVVMESNSAGLELCDHIRNTMRNHFTQLYLRTGQPGIAPEREVIDRYDINGYFTKVEADENKLYSLVKSGVRQFYSSKFFLELTLFTNKLISVAHSRRIMLQLLNSNWVVEQPDEEDGELESVMHRSYTFVDGEGIGGGLDPSEAQALMKRLEGLPGVPLGQDGNECISDDEHNKLIKIGAGRENSEIHHLIQGRFELPELAVRLTHSFWASFARLWYRAQ